jgi:hypothetical protein
MDEDKTTAGESVSRRKLQANRDNAKKSTGPKTRLGKSWSRLNASKHGILSSALLIKEGQGTEDAAEFDSLMNALERDLVPVGALEVMLVEKIAVCFWRQKRSLRSEGGLVRRAFAEKSFSSFPDLNPERNSIKDHLCLPQGQQLDGILRYETAIQRQLAHALNQLERMQRARRGEHVPAPLAVEFSKDS